MVLIVLAVHTHTHTHAHTLVVCVRCRAQETVAVKKCTSCSVAQAAAAAAWQTKWVSTLSHTHTHTHRDLGTFADLHSYVLSLSPSFTLLFANTHVHQQHFSCVWKYLLQLFQQLEPVVVKTKRERREEDRRLYCKETIAEIMRRGEEKGKERSGQERK